MVWVDLFRTNVVSLLICALSAEHVELRLLALSQLAALRKAMDVSGHVFVETHLSSSCRTRISRRSLLSSTFSTFSKRWSHPIWRRRRSHVCRPTLLFSLHMHFVEFSIPPTLSTRSVLASYCNARKWTPRTCQCSSVCCTAAVMIGKKSVVGFCDL
jgi:hypothetical protein